ncbi:tetratricopeptide repeat protein [Gimesia algae]|uniref:Lipoprotein NlpI n=1 Tax=Gimesia algae TaxID=2527971 RepID=A0A517VJ86_9PLAN|nr:tetratricopeptide repeat protein [Gimesia algae]QDT93060.1 Lipoprotein NlpI precursor [Gimesia algae]
MRYWILRLRLCSFVCLVCAIGIIQGEEPLVNPKADEETARLQLKLKQTIKQLSEQIESTPGETALYSRRGDAYFFNGDFKAAVADYNKMVELNPSISAAHWRRGIACYYAKQYTEAAKQFENYHSFDNVDRENGIWRFFSQYKAKGAAAAQQGLLKYEKDDREPFPDLYRMFQGKTAPETVVKNIESAKIDAQERSKRYFYAYLYIGLNESLQGHQEQARKFLKKSVENDWGPAAGFGPNYMWHTGRLELQLLTGPNRKPETKSE